MGGSGGGVDIPRPSPERVRILVERANEGADREAFEAEVNRELDEMLRVYNDRNLESVQRHLNVVERALMADGDETIELRYGGSVSKHTYVNGLSDVDVLVILNGSELAKKTAEAVIKEFAARLRRRLPNTAVAPGTLAVTVTYSDGTELQLLPAIKTAAGLRIARTVGAGWSHVVRPRAFAQKMTSINQMRGGRVVPTIKLFKAVFDVNCLPGMKLSGYHAESLAIAAFEHYSGDLTHKAMLHHLCQSAATRVLSPIRDRTGQSLHVDDYLGSARSTARRSLAAHLERLAKRMEMADRERNSNAWRELLEK